MCWFSTWAENCKGLQTIFLLDVENFRYVIATGKTDIKYN